MMGIGYLVGLLVVLWVAWPLVSSDEQRRLEIGCGRGEGLASRRDHIYEAMRDLDFELQTGKLTIEDHRAVRDEMLSSAALVLQEIEAAGPVSDSRQWIEQELRSRGAGFAAIQCSACKRDNRRGQRYCDGCGGSLEKTCAACGISARDEARFCGGCGAPL